MDVVQNRPELPRTEPPPAFADEFQAYAARVPDKGIFLAVLAGWCLLFQFYGISSFNFGVDTPSLLQWMYKAWNAPAMDSSQGNLIPFAVAALLWFKRKELAESISAPWWPALLLLGACLMLHVLGFMAQQPRVSLIAFFTGLYALVGVFWGWRTMKASFFPFFLFAFCMPFGNFIVPVTFPLRVLATKWTALICRDLLDIHIVQQGTLLTDPTGKINYEVAAACSGIRSFVALLGVTTVFAMLTFRSVWRRLLIVALTVPLVLLSNTLRLVAIVVATQAFDNRAGQAVHEWFWIVTYSLALGGIMLAARLLKEHPAA